MQKGIYMKKKVSLGLIIITGVVLSVCNNKTTGQQYDSEKDFEVEIIDNGKAAVITRYLGKKEEVKIPPLIKKLPVTGIGEWAFAECSLTNVEIPDTVVSIGSGAFSKNMLTRVIIPNSVTTIGAFAFEVNQLTDIEIPDSVTSIEEGAFRINQLTRVVIPDSLETITNGTFKTNELTSVVIPGSVTYIEANAFTDNPLTSVTIGEDVSLLSDRPFTSFDYDFDDLYYQKLSRAGTYTRNHYSWEPPIFEDSELDLKIRKIARGYKKKSMQQILGGYYYSSGIFYNYDEIRDIAIHSKEYFFIANEYREKKDYKKALEYYEIALSLYTWGAYYYQYAYCLMEMGDIENAEFAFKKAIDKIFYDYPYSMIAPYYHESGRNNIYTFDDNGIVREEYFTYYNLACIYSITNRLDESIDSLKLAVEYGYPYFNHIFQDNDLANLFNSPHSSQYREELNKLYQAGKTNNVIGKTFEYQTGPSSSVGYRFVDDTNVKKFLFGSDDKDCTLYGTYTIINYHIIINYDRRTGEKGYNPLWAASKTIFEYYVPYDIEINQKEYVSLKHMADTERGWEEK